MLLTITTMQNGVELLTGTEYSNYNGIKHLFGIGWERGIRIMSQNELELINLLHENDNPEMVADYMLSLFLDYLHKHGPSQEMPVAAPLESA